MPVVKIDLWELSSKQKEQLIKAIYKAFDVLPNIPKDAITIIISEIEKENWGVLGGPATKTVPEGK